MENRLTTFGHNFQIKSISSLMVNSNFMAQIYDILDESHYDNESLKWIIKPVSYTHLTLPTSG